MAQQLSRSAHEASAIVESYQAKVQPHVVERDACEDGNGNSDAYVCAADFLDRRATLYNAIGKRVFDVGVSLIVLPLALPVAACVAAGILLFDHRMPLFTQPRVGRAGRQFTIYKFRTMSPDRRQRDEPLTIDDRRKVHKCAGDPRVSRFGRAVRRASLDELPQLFNVLRGDMSLVGPRPELPGIVERYAAWQHARHAIRPGLTGWWQVYGRGSQPMHQHTDLDLYYVEQMSLWLDLRILRRRVPIAARTRRPACHARG